MTRTHAEPSRRMSSFVDTSESLIFLQDGKTIVAEYRYGSVLLWDIESKQARPAMPTESAAKKQHIHASYQGELYATSINGNTVKLWKVGSCESLIAEFTGNQPARLAAFAPTNNRLASAHEGGNLIIWDVQGGGKLREFKHPLQASTDDSDPAWKLVFSPDGSLLVSYTEDVYGPNIRLWDVERGEAILKNFRAMKSQSIGAFSPCGQYFVGHFQWGEKHHFCGMLDLAKF